jgi:hypothetical protein
MIKLKDLIKEAKEEWVGLDTIKRGGYGSPTLRNGDKVRMVVDARKNKYYNGVINGNSIKWEDGAKSELSLSMQASNRGDLQVLRPTSKSESIKEASDSDTYFNTATDAVEFARNQAEKKGYEIDPQDWNYEITMGGRYSRTRPGVGKTHSFKVGLLKGGKYQRKQLNISLYGMESGKFELTYYIN